MRPRTLLSPSALRGALIAHSHALARQACAHPEASVLLALSSLAGLAIAIFGHVVWASDSETFINYAYYLTRSTLDPGLFWRAPGYPILIILSGALVTGSLAGLYAMQLVSGALVPVLVYSAIAPASRKAAFVTGLVVVASFIAYTYASFIYHDQFILFGLVLVTALTIRVALGSAGRWTFYALTAVLILVGWMRPTVIAAIPIVALAVVFHRAYWRRALVCLAVFLAANLGFGLIRSSIYDHPGMMGRQLFYAVYLGSDGMALEGRDGQALRDKLAAYFASEESGLLDPPPGGPLGLRDTYAEVIEPHLGDPEAMADSFFAHSHVAHFWYLWRITSTSSQQFGVEWDPLFLRASVEHILADPGTFLCRRMGVYKAFALGPAWRYHQASYVAEAPVFGPFMPQYSDPRTANFARRIKIHPSWFEASPQRSWEPAVNNAFVSLYGRILPASYVLMIVGVLGYLLTPGPARTASLIVFAMHSANTVTMSLLVDPQGRYQMELLPLAMIGGGIGMLRLATWSRVLATRSLDALSASATKRS